MLGDCCVADDIVDVEAIEEARVLIGDERVSIMEVQWCGVVVVFG